MGYQGDGLYELGLNDFVECFIEIQQPGLRGKVSTLL